ncbi:MAG: glutamate 5-kinase [Anaerolineales bacterium]|nr:glutamate 5-kinase [Anaerolineales bacterium]
MSRIIIKLGTSTLTEGNNHLSLPRMVDLVRQMSLLRDQGHEVILVSSGAVAAGRQALNFPQLPKSIPAKQMLAAVGQTKLMDTWGDLFAIYNIPVGQVLLTRDDLNSRNRYLNARNTLLAMLKQGVIPIINENDTVATEEIRVGDNDNLSALVSNLVAADLLMLLTDQDGLYTADPRSNPDAHLISLIDTPQIDPAIWESAGGGGRLGTGGMQTKLQAADLARRSGVTVVIARGRAPDVILAVARGEPLGTRFTPVESAVESFKRFMLSGGKIGTLEVDKGAAAAILRGGSVLPPGIATVNGNFERGQSVGLLDPNGVEIARGLVNYKADDIRRIARHQSYEIEAILGYFYGEEVIHRSNLVLLV